MIDLIHLPQPDEAYLMKVVYGIATSPLGSYLPRIGSIFVRLRVVLA